MENQEQQVRTITVEEANLIRETCKERIDLAEALTRLEKNTDFQKVVMKDYLEKEPVRLVGLLGEQNFNMGGKKAEYRDDIHEQMIGISRFSAYMRSVYSLANQATKMLDDLNSAE